MEAADPDVAPRPSWRIDLFLVLAVLALSVPMMRVWSTQPASRYLFTVAIHDDHSLRLDPYRASLGDDFAEVDGHIVSDKAPYQPVSALPVYAAYRLLGGERFPSGVTGYDVGHTQDIGLWLVTLWSATLPLAALIVLIRRYVARTRRAHAVPVALALVFGTVVLPFGSMLFGHVMAAALGFGAWMLIRGRAPGTGALIATGLLLSIGIGVEYPQAALAAILGGYCIMTFRTRALWVALGGVIGLVPMLATNAAIFGSPFKTAYSGYQPAFRGSGAFGVVNLKPPIPRELALALVGDRGMFSLTPIMLLALAGCFISLRARRPVRVDAIMALTLLVVYIILSTGVDGYGGSAPGPRYLVPIIPFFALPLAEAWRRWTPVTTIAALWSAFWMVLATITDPLYQRGGPAAIDWLRDAFAGNFDNSIPGYALGQPAVLLAVVAAAAAAWAAWRADNHDRRAPTGPARPTEGAAPPHTSVPATAPAAARPEGAS